MGVTDMMVLLSRCLVVVMLVDYYEALGALSFTQQPTQKSRFVRARELLTLDPYLT